MTRKDGLVMGVHRLLTPQAGLLQELALECTWLELVGCLGVGSLQRSWIFTEIVT